MLICRHQTHHKLYNWYNERAFRERACSNINLVVPSNKHTKWAKRGDMGTAQKCLCGRAHPKKLSGRRKLQKLSICIEISRFLKIQSEIY